MTIKEILENELARAEAIVGQAEKEKRRKRHQPTIDIHKGQIIAFRKVLSWLDIDTQYVRTPIEIKSYLTISWPLVFFTVAALVAIMIIVS
jgi:hypothetical protein